MAAGDDRLMALFRAPEGAGRLEGATGKGTADNPSCGDLTELQVRVADGRVEAAAFLCQGCPAAIGGASFLTQRAQGLTVDEARALDVDRLIEELGGLSATRRHGISMAIRALRAAVG